MSRSFSVTSYTASLSRKFGGGGGSDDVKSALVVRVPTTSDCVVGLSSDVESSSGGGGEVVGLGLRPFAFLRIGSSISRNLTHL